MKVSFMIPVLYTSLVVAVWTFFAMSEYALINRDFQEEYRDARKARVSAAENFIIGVPYNSESPTSVQAVSDLEMALDKINASGGIMGKQAVLRKEGNVRSTISYYGYLEEVCTPFDTAVCIGPFDTRHLVSGRAITHEKAVPYISPVAEKVNGLPALSDDNFVGFYPELHYFTDAVYDDIIRRNIRSILFICPDRDSYGDLFCTDIESRFKGKSFMGIYRVNYLFPLNESPSVLLDTYLHNPELGAIVFAGVNRDISNLARILSGYNLRVPVYTTNVISVKTAGGYSDISWQIPVLEIEGRELNITGIPDTGNNSSYTIPELIMNTLKRVLDSSVYDPATLPVSLRREIREINENIDSRMSIRLERLPAKREKGARSK